MFRPVKVAVLITIAVVLTISVNPGVLYAQHGTAPHPPMTRGDEAVVETKSLPTVDSVELAIKKSSGDTLPNLTLNIGELVAIEGSELTLIASDFYTHWKWKNRPINKTYDEDNPAVKVDVFKSDSLLYTRWAFQNMPFFGLQGALGHTGEAEKELGFTLLNYTGLVIPQDSTGTTEE